MTPAEIAEHYPQAPNAVAHMEGWPEDGWNHARDIGDAGAVLTLIRIAMLRYVTMGDERRGPCTRAEAKLIVAQLDSADFKAYLGAKMGML